jgi:DNA-binding NtrC family response regulator
LTQAVFFAIFSPFARDKDVSPIHATEGDSLNSQCNVLIVDRLEETREVLQTVLERHGLRTMAAGKMEKGMELARRLHPDLVVLDLEMEDVPSESLWGDISEDKRDSPNSADAKSGTVPYQPQMILLGSLRGLPNRMPGGEIVRKPFHYGLLIRKIEELLEQKG